MTLRVLGGPPGGGDHVSALKGFESSNGAAQRSVPLPERMLFAMTKSSVDASRCGLCDLQRRTKRSSAPRGVLDSLRSSPHTSSFLPPTHRAPGLRWECFRRRRNLTWTTYASWRSSFFASRFDRGRVSGAVYAEITHGHRVAVGPVAANVVEGGAVPKAAVQAAVCSGRRAARPTRPECNCR